MPRIRHTQGPWTHDSDMVSIEDQAKLLIEHIGTPKQWQAVGIDDSEGFAEVVALCHPNNARLIAAAPKLLAALKRCANRLGEMDCGPELDEARQAIREATQGEG